MNNIVNSIGIYVVASFLMAVVREPMLVSRILYFMSFYR